MESQSFELTHPRATSPQKAQRLRVLLDARKLGDGGIGTYIHNLVLGLVGSGEVELTAIVSSAKRMLLPAAEAVNVITDNSSGYSLDEMFSLGRRIDFTKFELFHSPHYTLPLGIKIPCVVTVHDLIHQTHPEKWYYPFLSRVLIGSALKRADRIVTVSAASAQAISLGFKPHQSKIRIIPNAVDPEIANVGARDLIKKFDLTNNSYIFAVFSNIKPHKGFRDLLEAFKIASKDMPELKLVIAGNAIASDMISAEPNIIYVGSPDKKELSALYLNSRFLSVPSLAEGFGLTVLEAKALNVPVVCRPVPAVKELLDESDIVAKDNSIIELSNALKLAARKFSEQRNMNLNERIIKNYSNQKIATQMVELYRDVLTDGFPKAGERQ